MELAGVRFRSTDQIADFAVTVGEGFAQYVRRALGRSEAFEQLEQGERDRLALLGEVERAVRSSGEDRLRQPFADVRLASYAGGREVGQAEVGDGPGEECRRVEDVCPRGLLPPDPGILQHLQLMGHLAILTGLVLQAPVAAIGGLRVPLRRWWR